MYNREVLLTGQSASIVAPHIARMFPIRPIRVRSCADGATPDGVHGYKPVAFR